MIDKYNLSPLQRVVEMTKHGCCTQGMLLLQHQEPGLIQGLEEQKSGPTDLRIEEYANATGLRRCAYAPPQIQHTGSISSHFIYDINVRSRWAFWFDDNDPQVLDREHESLVRGGKVPWSPETFVS